MGQISEIIVIHFSDCFYPRINGVTIAIESIANSLSKNGMKNIIVCPSYTEDKDIKIEDYKGIKTIRIPSFEFIFNKEDRFINLFNTKNLYNIIGNEIRNFSSIIFLFHNIMNSFIVGYKVYKLLNKELKKRVTKVMYYHTFWQYYLHYIPLPYFISEKILNILEKQTLLKVDYIMVSNEYVKSNIYQKFKINKEIIVNPIPLNEIFFTKSTLKIDNDNFMNNDYFLYVGRLGKEKNLYFLINVFKRILEKGLNFDLYIVGDGPEKQNLISYCKQKNIQNKVHFLGYLNQEEILTLYKNCKAFLFASKTETLGLVVLEAIISGALVFTLNVPPFDQIIHNYKDGILIEKEEEDYFANKVIEVLNNQEMINNIKNNTKTVMSKYSPIYFINNLYNVLYPT